MQTFDIDRKGYNISQVNDYISSMQQKYEAELSSQQQLLLELKNSNSTLSQRLNEYLKKDGEISSALVVAVETAKEIENSAKTVYELEIQRVKLLYSKWQAVLKQITALHPEISEESSVYYLFKDFEQNIVNILERENQIQRVASESALDNKTYARTLLNRIKESNYSTLGQKKPNQSSVQIKRKDKKNAIAKEIEREQKRVDALSSIDEIPQISEFERFMNSEFDDFNAFQSGGETTHTPNLFEANIVSHNQQDGGFDLKEALTPKEDLEDIMKIFDLDEAN